MTIDSHKAMNQFIRGEQVGEESPISSELTPEQAARIENYIELGIPYQEARDLVRGAVSGSKIVIPSGNAGQGRGDQGPGGGPSMNDWIRKAAGFFKWGL